MPTTGIVAPAILQSLPDVVVVADVNGRIVYTNPAVRTLLGHDPADLRGAPLTRLIPERRGTTPVSSSVRTGWLALRR